MECSLETAERGAVMVALQRFNLMFDAIARIVHVTLALMFAALVWFAFDRAPPFEMLHVYPAQAKVGEQITVYAYVRRQISRNCSAKMSRAVFDSIQDRFDLGDSFFTADMIERMEFATPGRVALRFTIPPTSRPGSAALVSALEYSCNATHRVWPIAVTTVAPFTILPP